MDFKNYFFCYYCLALGRVLVFVLISVLISGVFWSKLDQSFEILVLILGCSTSYILTLRLDSKSGVLQLDEVPLGLVEFIPNATKQGADIGLNWGFLLEKQDKSVHNSHSPDIQN